MESLTLMLFVCLSIPLAMMLLVFKGHPRLVILFFMIGMLMCVLAGEINGIFYNRCFVSYKDLTVSVAPFVEEILKAIPVIYIAFLLKPKRQSLAELSLAVGVGFATLENVYVLFTSTEKLSFGYILLRALGAGMMHGICTLVIGIVLGTIIEHRLLFISGTLAALSMAVIYHSIYNMLIISHCKYVGIMMPAATFALLTAAGIRPKLRSQKPNERKSI